MLYDPGVGHSADLPGATWWDTARRRWDRIAGLAFGRGVYENVAECYQFLMQQYQPGDQILVFGFSRGAFTARSVAGLISQFGVLQPHMVSLLPTVLSLYFSDRSGGQDGAFQAITAQARRLFEAGQTQPAEVHFIGVWDTVATVGMPPFAARFTALPKVQGKGFLHVRQALALDEQRAQFKPRLYADDNGQHSTRSGHTGSLVQLWFHGAHADVGGGEAPAVSGLGQAPFCWLVSEAVACGLRLHHQGQPLDSEAAVAAALAGLPSAFPVPSVLRVNTQLHPSPIWALTGLAVRDPSWVDLDGRAGARINPVAHASVQAQPLSFPSHTAWAAPRAGWPLLLAALLLPLLLLAIGQLQHGLPWSVAGRPLTAGESIGLVALHAGDYLQANARFLVWQASGMGLGDSPCRPGLNCSPQGALLLDLALMATLAYLLARGASWAFARRAGLRGITDRPAPWLQRLGWALPVMVAGDLLENLFTSLSLGLMNQQADLLAALTRLLMAAATWVHVLATLAVLALILSGAWPARQAATAGATPQRSASTVPANTAKPTQ